MRISALAHRCQISRQIVTILAARKTIIAPGARVVSDLIADAVRILLRVRRAFESVEEARSEAFSYIEGYYNWVKLHSSLDYKTPQEFELELQIKERRTRESCDSIST